MVMAMVRGPASPEQLWVFPVTRQRVAKEIKEMRRQQLSAVASAVEALFGDIRKYLTDRAEA
jgi:hypothetical protein